MPRPVQPRAGYTGQEQSGLVDCSYISRRPFRQPTISLAASEAAVSPEHYGEATRFASRFESPISIS
jgi:hypothetical protein